MLLKRPYSPEDYILPCLTFEKFQRLNGRQPPLSHSLQWHPSILSVENVHQPDSAEYWSRLLLIPAICRSRPARLCNPEDLPLPCPCCYTRWHLTFLLLWPCHNWQ